MRNHLPGKIHRYDKGTSRTIHSSSHPQKGRHHHHLRAHPTEPFRQGLFDLVEKNDKAEANIKSLKEPWLDTTTPQGRLLFTIFSGVSQFEKELIVERTRAGLKAARARGRKGGHPKVNKDAIEQAMTLYDSQKYPVSQILKMSGICRRTLYKYINIRKEEQEKQQKQQ